MKFMKIEKVLEIAAIGAAIALGANGTAALADTISVSYLAPGVQTPTTPNVENFNNATLNPNGTFTTTFNNSGITGTYSGGFTIVPADVYGGASATGLGGPAATGDYITAEGDGTTYTLSLSQNVNYFGYWLSALDAGNQVQLLENGNVVFTFVPADLITALGSCATPSANAYCGNPNGGGNDPQLYAYVNFYDTNGSFNEIKYTETIPNAGYESDNHAVDVLSTGPGGTPLGAVPEPSSLMLLGTGVIGIASTLRKKLLA
jgi:hypothetical protein